MWEIDTVEVGLVRASSYLEKQHTCEHKERARVETETHYEIAYSPCAVCGATCTGMVVRVGEDGIGEQSFVRRMADDWDHSPTAVRSDSIDAS